MTVPPAVAVLPIVTPISVTVTAVLAASAVPPVVMTMEVGLLVVLKRAEMEVGRRCGDSEWKKEKPSGAYPTDWLIVMPRSGMAWE